MKWIARWPGKVLKPHDAKELLQLLRAGALNVYDHVYDPKEKQWVRLVELEAIHHGLAHALGFEPPVDAPEMRAFATPDFHPPTLLIQHALSPERSFEGESFEITYEDEVPTGASSEELEFQKQLVEQLQAQNDELRAELSRNPFDGVKDDLEYEYKLQMDALRESAREEINQLQKELEFLKTEAISREDELQELKQEGGGYKERVIELENANAELNIQLSSKEEKLEEYLRENEKIVSEFKKLAKNNQSMKDRLNEVAAKVDRERKTSAALKQNMLKLNEGLVLLKRKSERDRTVIQDLERYKKIHDAKEEQELNRLIGDSFEVDNSPMWWIKIEGEDKGPYTYGDMRSFMKYNKISMSTQSKKTGGEWQDLGGHFEFRNEVLCKEEMRDGKKHQRYFIKRGDFRAPFYDLAQMEVGANSYKGYCTSISVGGCFIELSKIDKIRMEKGGKVMVKIKAGTLSEELNVRAVIRNISDKRPRGLGLQFENLTEAQKDVIIEFVHQYVNSSSKKNAA